MRIKKTKKAVRNRSRTTLRNNSKGRERCKTYMKGDIGEKNSDVLYVSEKTQTPIRLKHIVKCAESVLTAPNDVLSEKFTILF